jgi:hypothetical protein
MTAPSLTLTSFWFLTQEGSMIALNLIFIVLAFVCFLLATIGVPARVNLIALGLAFYMLALLAPVLR